MDKGGDAVEGEEANEKQAAAEPPTQSSDAITDDGPEPTAEAPAAAGEAVDADGALVTTDDGDGGGGIKHESAEANESGDVKRGDKGDAQAGGTNSEEGKSEEHVAENEAERGLPLVVAEITVATFKEGDKVRVFNTYKKMLCDLSAVNETFIGVHATVRRTHTRVEVRGMSTASEDAIAIICYCVAVYAEMVFSLTWWNLNLHARRLEL